MVDLDTATRIVSEHLAAMERRMNDFGSTLPGHADRPQLHLVVTSTTEYDFGWLFTFGAREYLETGDLRCALAGNALSGGGGKLGGTLIGAGVGAYAGHKIGQNMHNC